MSDLIDQGYIDKKEKGSSEYEKLYLEGIDILQKISGNVWTDYNVHDPGVTILENLSYTLTQLTYSTEFPVGDLLTDSKGEQLVSGDNGLFTAAEVLTSNPVTIKDYRKLFIDGVTNVKNVWLSTSVKNDFSTGLYKNPLSGLYNVFVEVYNYSTELAERAEELERIKKEIRAYFNKSRNLCENINTIAILNPLNLKIKLRLKLEESANGEEVFANVFYQIGNYLSHEVKFCSLSSLLSNGYTLDEIFEGPLLQNGFIKNEELRDKLDVILPADIVRLISSFPEVVNVDLFEIYFCSDQERGTYTKIDEKGYSVDANNALSLLFPIEKKDFCFEQSDAVFYPDLTEVERQLMYIQAHNYGVFKSTSQPQNFNELPEGQLLGVSSYYSVREQFPLVYGIGHFGLQKDLPPKRYAQANQLKAYLLPFDQIMANYLGQLNHLYNLYDVSPINEFNTDKIQSYFYQVLEDMDSLTHLIHVENENLNSSQKLHHWNGVLENLNKQQDSNPLKRLQAVADHLLARYNEEYANYALSKINESSYGYNNLANYDLDLELLNNKRKLIANYGRIGYNRNRAIDLSQKIIFSNEKLISDDALALVPGVVEKISILLNITDYSIRPLSKVITTSGIRIYKKNTNDSLFVSEGLETILSQSEIEANSFENVFIIDDNVESLSDTFYFIGNEKEILNSVLKQGVLKYNYSIKSTPSGADQKWFVLFKSEDLKPYVTHIAYSKKEAEIAIQENVNFLTQLSKKSEGLYSVEHLLLAPSFNGAYFGFSFELKINLDKTFSFKHITNKTYDQRNSDIVNLIDIANKGTSVNYEIVYINGRYFIQLNSQSGVPLICSEQSYNSEEEANNDLSILSDCFKRKNYEIVKINYYTYYGKHEVNEDFFSFQISLFFPAWPVRFQSDSFKMGLQNLIQEQAPAHIAFYKHWLSLEEMIEFEEVYYDWISLFSNKYSEEDKMELSYKIIRQIKKMQGIE